MGKALEKKTVLIVEDEKDIRSFTSRVLELEGYRVLQAENGNEGLRLARMNQVALILLDLRLPGRSGWALLVLLKSEPGLCRVPVIVFTASAAVAERDRALRMGAVAYVVKPLSAASLKETVARVLSPGE